MALEGTFKDFGLADIFQLVGLQKKTGVLTVRGEAGKVVTVSFEKGMVVFADEFQRSENERLGSVLLRTRRVVEADLERAIAVQQQTAQRLGYILMDQGFITGEELRQALQLQVKETVYRLFRWKEGGYHFSPEPVTYDREMYVPLAAEFVLMEGIRMIDEWPIIEKKISSFQAVYERVPGAAAPPPKARGAAPKTGIDDLLDIVGEAGEEGSGGSFERGSEALGPKESAVLALVDGERTVQDLIDIGQLGEFETCKALYALLSLNLVRAREGAVPEAAAPQPGGARAAGHGRGPRGRSGAAVPEGRSGRAYGIAAAAAALLVAAFLFNPWGVVAQGFRSREGRRAAAALREGIREQRVRLALEVFFLEKQAYPTDLAKLAESGLLRPRELRAGGRPFAYRGGGREFRLGRD